MIEVRCNVLKRSIKTERVIATIEGDNDGPVFIFTAGLHGNEPTGVFALKDVFDEINNSNLEFHGKAIALAGNMKALHQNKRYIKEDLNRIWTEENILQIRNGFDANKESHPEKLEMYELFKYLEEHFSNREDKEFFIDLHTTSAPTMPFIALSNMHGNLNFASRFHIPVVSNIDKYLHHPMLAHANHTGSRHISMAFEAGQHHHTEAFENHKDFIMLALHNAGCLTNHPDFDENQHLRKLSKKAVIAGVHGNYRVIYHYLIGPGEKFVMQPGFENFQTIEKGQLLATSNGRPVHAPSDGAIFMPLYQKLGDDGFFLIRKED